MIENIISLLISIWVLMAVAGIKPFEKQQEVFLNYAGRKTYISVFSIVAIYSLYEIAIFML